MEQVAQRGASTGFWGGETIASVVSEGASRSGPQSSSSQVEWGQKSRETSGTSYAPGRHCALEQSGAVGLLLRPEAVCGLWDAPVITARFLC